MCKRRTSLALCVSPRLLLLALLGLVPLLSQATDSPWLYGIHWYGDTGQSDVEAMSGGKPIYVTDQVFTNILDQNNGWELPGPKNNEWQIITGAGKGHTIIARLQPNWGRQIPLASDAPYTLSQYVTDAVAAANTLKNVCHIWQIGNEMNILDEHGGTAFQATDYVDAYRQLRTAIHGVTSPLGNQIVLLGPVSPGDVIGGVRWRSGDDYLNDMLTSLSPSEVDGIALHAYGAGAPDSAVSGWRASIAEQLAIVKAHGFGDKPIYLTEWNRDTPDQSYEAASAQFLYKAYEELYDWNTTPGNQNVIAATWFVYPSGVGWDDYSLQFYKSLGGTKDDDLWAAFNYAATQDYPAGRVGGGNDGPAQGASFDDEFNSTQIDRFGPEPDWTITGFNGGTASENGAELVLKANGNNYAGGAVSTDGYFYDDFVLETRVTFTDATPRHPGLPQQSNAEVRWRLQSAGYSLTLDAAADKINLRRANLWTLIGSYEQSVTINTGDSFNIRIEASGNSHHIQVGRGPSGVNDVVDWTVTNSEYATGTLFLGSYAAEEIRFDYARVTVPSAAGAGWVLYD